MLVAINMLRSVVMHNVPSTRVQRVAVTTARAAAAVPWPPRRGACAAAAAAAGAAASSAAANAGISHIGEPHRAAAATADADGAPHVPVLLEEVMQQFSGRAVKVYVDCTLGAGGHAVNMLRRHPEMERLIGIDLDPTAHRIAGARLADAAAAAAAGSGPRINLLRGNYADITDLLAGLAPPLAAAGAAAADAILLDAGVSSMQLDTPGRGFSFAQDGPLDMRLGGPDGGGVGQGLTAADAVNGWSEAELGRVLREYGEERAWRTVARRIVDARELAPITTTRQLVAAVGRTTFRSSSGGSKGGSKGGKGRDIHPATRTFQALRIAVNDELRGLERAVPAAIRCLSPGGRLAVISFHSLEDRIVKYAMLRAAGRPTPEDEALTYGGIEGLAELDRRRAAALGDIVTRKPVTAGAAEVAANPRARSAKLRVFERAGGDGASDQQQRGSKKRRRGDVEQQQP